MPKPSHSNPMPDKVQAVENPAVSEMIKKWGEAAQALYREKSDPGPLSREISLACAQDPILAEAFLKVLSESRDPWVGNLLPNLSPPDAPKPWRRRVKALIYRRRQQGMDIPPAKETREGPGILRQTDIQSPEGFFFEYDDFGNRLVALSLPRMPKGRILALAVIHWDRGLEDLSALEVPKKQIRPVLEEIREYEGRSFYAGDAGQAAFLLREARKRTGRLKMEDEQTFARLLPYLEALGKGLLEPAVRSLPAVAEAALESRAKAEDLLTVPELVRFQWSDEELAPYAEALREIRESPLVLSGGQRDIRIRGVIDQAVGKIFEPSRLDRLFRFIEEIAYTYWIRGQEGKAGEVMAALAECRQEVADGPGTVHPLLAWLLEKALVPGEVDDEETEPIPEEERTEGGLIIPSWVKK